MGVEEREANWGEATETRAAFSEKSERDPWFARAVVNGKVERTNQRNERSHVAIARTRPLVLFCVTHAYTRSRTPRWTGGYYITLLLASLSLPTAALRYCACQW